MGDFADMAVDDALNFGHNWWGDYDDEYEHDEGSTWIGSYRLRRRQFKVCNVCGATGLRWAIHDDRWALEERDGRRHTCKFKKAFKRV